MALPLPKCPGPKLEPFTDSGFVEDIKFIHSLSSSENIDGYVWKVEINGKLYALKMFLLGDIPNPREYDDKDRWEAEFHYRYAFNCECRAYGRLKEAKREDLAVRAHGYLCLSEQQEQQMNDLYCSDDIWYRCDWQKGQVVHAIVKDLVEDASNWEPTDIPKMYADLKAFHELGILIGDVHGANYLNGHLVDLSRASTVPDLAVERYPWRCYKRERTKDAQDLWVMVRDWNEENEGSEIPMPPGLNEYIRWDFQSLGEHACHPYDLEWKVIFDDAFEHDEVMFVRTGGMCIADLEDPEPDL